MKLAPLRILAAFLTLSAAVSFVHADDRAPAEKLAPLSKPVKALLIGNWTVKLEIDPKLAEKSLAKDGIPKDRIPAVIKQMNAIFARTTTTVQINADGTSVAVATVPDPAGGKKPKVEREEEKWDITESKVRTASIKLTGVDGQKKGKSRIVKITFLNDNAFRLDEDADLKDVPVKKPVFVRARNAKKK